jgi:hypothetical protein
LQLVAKHGLAIAFHVLLNRMPAPALAKIISIRTPEDRHRFPQSVRACMTAATIEASTGPRIRTRAPVNSTSIIPGDIGNGAKGVVGAVGCGNSFCSRRVAP